METATGDRPQFRAVMYVTGSPQIVAICREGLIRRNRDNWPATIPDDHLPYQSSDTRGNTDYSENETCYFHRPNSASPGRHFARPTLRSHRGGRPGRGARMQRHSCSVPVPADVGQHHQTTRTDEQ